MVGCSLLPWRSLANPFCGAQNCGLHYMQFHHICTASPIKLYDPGAIRSRWTLGFAASDALALQRPVTTLDFVHI